ncbi:MAG: prolipoprotein diacylglyceryl transferase [Myxococcota bacterium]
MLPYVEAPSLALGPVELNAFPVLVAVATVVGFEVCVRRAPALGFDRDEAGRILVWTIAGGFVSSHLVAIAITDPAAYWNEPLRFLRLWEGMSSMGGVLGGIAVGVFAMRRAGMDGEAMLRFVDGVAFAFPFAWIFGRAACALAHDHPGIASDHFLAVAFPDGPRFDLGLLELFFTLGIAALFAGLARRPRPSPFYLGLFFTLYGPVRFGLDTLRVADTRWAGLTFAQYACVALTVTGVVLLARLRSR